MGRLTAISLPAPVRTASLDVFFRDPRNYLERRRYEIQLRGEAVSELVGRAQHKEILDVGCGDGSISLPLLTSSNHLTLVDVCGRMLALAESHIPPGLGQRVTTLQADVMTAPLVPGSYDLILCLGVLAHVESASEVISRLASLLRREATLILQFTDSRHLLGRAMRFYGRVASAARPPVYRLNLLTASDVLSLASENGLQLVRTYRYGSLPPGAHRVFSQRILYRVIRALYGTVAHNRHACLGNEYICEFRPSSSSPVLRSAR